MQFGLLALLAISLGAMFFGYFFGLFEGRGQGYKKRKKEEDWESGTGRTTDRAAGGPAQGGSTPAAADHEVGLLQLGLDKSGHATLHLDGGRVDGSALSAAQRKRLIELMLIMRPWVEGGASRAAPPAPMADPHPSMTDRLRAATGSGEGRKGATSTAAVPGPIPAAGALSITPQMSIVAQIDTILQRRLVGTPLASLGIRLTESAEGGVTVEVGLDQFASVGDVPQPEVQAAIRAAIKEWEEKYTPS
jgi:hypothetical protein